MKTRFSIRKLKEALFELKKLPLSLSSLEFKTKIFVILTKNERDELEEFIKHNGISEEYVMF